MIPTLTNVDHIGFTVPDLQQAMDFFTKVMGAKEILKIGPFSVDQRAGSVTSDGEAADDPDWMWNHLRMHPRATLNAGLMQLGPTLVLELYEVDAPGANKTWPTQNDVGAPHLAFRVQDIDAAVEFLRQQDGVVLHGEIETFDEGPIAGMRWLHWETPWGLVLEVDQWPDTMPFEETTDARWTPFQDSWGTPAASGGALIPTMTNADHVGLVVPDLQQAIDFFRDVVGAKEIFTIGPFSVEQRAGSGAGDGGADDDPDWMYNHLRMHPRANLDAALLQLGPTLVLELYDVDAPEAKTRVPAQHDVGAAHIAFRVTDIDQAVDYLRQQEGVVLHGDIEGYDDGPIAGMRWLHWETPWGQVLEVDQWPDVIPIEATSEGKWAPAQASWETPAGSGR